jgi:K+-transporting ATPase KdpF subunit
MWPAASDCKEVPMLVEYVLGGVVTAALLVYLVYALLRPERF